MQTLGGLISIVTRRLIMQKARRHPKGLQISLKSMNILKHTPLTLILI